jgi:bifunctional oligoribonuclease and PAP phosphatase NrnA
MLNPLLEKLKNANSIVLSTHRNCDGDGLGGQLALLHGLKKLGKSVRILNVDCPARKYDFLGTDQWVHVHEPGSPDLQPSDVGLILDTNDGRLLEPLFSELKSKCRDLYFVDHHPILAQGPAPTPGSLIDTSSASTGQLCYRILKGLGVEFDAEIARALYTSIVFDTQLFRFVRSAPESHLIAAELLHYEREPEEIHRRLFATYSVAKMGFLAKALSRVEYHSDSRLAFVALGREDFAPTNEGGSGFERDDSGDVIDLVMNIDRLEVAALLREDAPGRFKLSLRSKGTLPVQALAESFGGGGHRNASGAYIEGSFEPLRKKILEELGQMLEQPDESRQP